MKREDIIYDGLHSYRLVRDVKNPNGDKRQKHDWRNISIWEAGMTFVATTETIWVPLSVDGPEEMRKLPVMQKSHTKFPGLYRCRPDRLPDEFFAALAPDKLSIRERLEAQGEENLYSSLLDVLVKIGKITVEDIDAAVDVHNKTE